MVNPLENLITERSDEFSEEVTDLKIIMLEERVSESPYVSDNSLPSCPLDSQTKTISSQLYNHSHLQAYPEFTQLLINAIETSKEGFVKITNDYISRMREYREDHPILKQNLKEEVFTSIQEKAFATYQSNLKNQFDLTREFIFKGFFEDAYYKLKTIQEYMNREAEILPSLFYNAVDALYAHGLEKVSEKLKILSETNPNDPSLIDFLKIATHYQAHFKDSKIISQDLPEVLERALTTADIKTHLD